MLRSLFCGMVLARALHPISRRLLVWLVAVAKHLHVKRCHQRMLQVVPQVVPQLHKWSPAFGSRPSTRDVEDAVVLVHDSSHPPCGPPP